MLSLFAKAREVAGLDGIAADWSLPEEITKMKVRVRRQQSEGVTFSIGVSGEVKEPDIVDQLKVWQHGGKVYLDKRQGIGSWEETKETKEPFFVDYQSRSSKTTQEIPGGLYLINLTLKNGKSMDGWFILTPDLNMSRSPQVNRPHYGQVFKTNKPTFSFENYFSPQYKSHEIRSLWLGISDENWISGLWDFWERSPHRTQMTLDEEKSSGKRELDPGNYVFTYVINEDNKFGDVWIGRSAIVLRPFSVVK